MRIVLEIFLGLLYFNCLFVCCLYFRNKNPLEQYKEEYSSYLETVTSTEYGKTVKGKRTPDFVHQS